MAPIQHRVVKVKMHPIPPTDARPCERIMYLLVEVSGTVVPRTPDEAAGDILEGRCEYYTLDLHGRRTLLQAVKSPTRRGISVPAHGERYVRSAPNDTEDDNLLTLPRV